MPHGPEDIYDQMLVLRCQSRDAEAFRALVDRWHPRLLRHACRMTGSHDLARDVTQETWLNITKSIHKLRDPATFPCWAFRITSRRAADAIRLRQRERQTGAALRDQAQNASHHRAHDSTDDNHSALRSALSTLSLDDQALLSLHYVEALGVSDLSQVFDIPRGTAKSRLYHARERLRAAITQQNKHPQPEVKHERTGPTNP